jgi:LysR family transcriptional regulator, hypochlorite-specific transcription factor HypT
MELKWLEDFVCLVKTGSFSRASEERNVTQPALSRRIRALENWLGVSLIDRSSYPISLTQQGSQFLPYAQEIIKSSYAIRDDFRVATDPRSNTVRIVTLHTLSIHFLPDYVLQLAQARRDARAVVVPSVQGIAQHFEALTNGIAHLLVTYRHEAIGANLLNPSEIEERQIGTDTLLPVVSRRFSQQKNFTDVRAAKEPVPYLAYSEFSFSGKVVAPMSALVAKRLQPVYENNLSESLKALVLKDAGLAWLPELAILQELARGELVPVGDGPLVARLEIVVYRTREKVNDVVRAMWDLLCTPG